MRTIVQATLLVGALTAVVSADGAKSKSSINPPAKANDQALTAYAPQNVIGSSMQPCGNMKAPPKPGEGFAKFACEPGGSNVVVGVNLIHFRIETATAAQANDKAKCQREAQSAVAISRGVARFRDEAKTAKSWATGLTYRTRYDGDLDEQKLFELVTKNGDAAAKLFTACGGTKLAITRDDEMQFKAAKQTPVDYSKAMLTLHNQDGSSHDYTITCPNGSSARGAIQGNGTSYEGSNMKGCTIKIDEKSSIKAPGDVDCDIKGGAISCR
jgi:hypothetical protein